MTHDLTEETRERAALYALGQLTIEDALAFERHLAEGCEVCLAEVTAFEEVYAQIALTAPAAAPSPQVRERIISQLGQTQEPRAAKSSVPDEGSAQTLTVFAEEGEWQELSEGVFIKKLYTDERKGTVTTLFKMLPGAHAQPHKHLGVEECFVLEGDFHVGDLVLGRGDYHMAEEGSIHQDLYSEKGNLLLIISPKEGYQLHTQ